METIFDFSKGHFKMIDNSTAVRLNFFDYTLTDLNYLLFRQKCKGSI